MDICAAWPGGGLLSGLPAVWGALTPKLILLAYLLRQAGVAAPELARPVRPMNPRDIFSRTSTNRPEISVVDSG